MVKEQVASTEIKTTMDILGQPAKTLLIRLHPGYGPDCLKHNRESPVETSVEYRARRVNTVQSSAPKKVEMVEGKVDRG